jgi:hypothetical protein
VRRDDTRELSVDANTAADDIWRTVESSPGGVTQDGDDGRVEWSSSSRNARPMTGRTPSNLK